MHQSWDRHMRIFAARIGHVVRGRPSLFDTRNYLTPDRIVRILLPRDQVEKMRSHREGEFVGGKKAAAAFLLAKLEILRELSERSDPVLELPFPIVPNCQLHPPLACP